MARELLLNQRDREAYGVDAVDFLAAMRWLDEQAYDVLDDVEKQIMGLLGDDMTLSWVVSQIVLGSRVASSVRMLRVRMWLGLRATGSEVKLADFTPHVYSVKLEKPAKGDDASPPAESAESSSSSTTPMDTAASETSTSG